MCIMMGMDPREALARIRDMHRGVLNDAGVMVCAECTPTDDDVYLAVDFPCETRRICDEVLSPGEFVTADPWPTVLPGVPTA